MEIDVFSCCCCCCFFFSLCLSFAKGKKKLPVATFLAIATPNSWTNIIECKRHRVITVLFVWHLLALDRHIGVVQDISVPNNQYAIHPSCSLYTFWLHYLHFSLSSKKKKLHTKCSLLLAVVFGLASLYVCHYIIIKNKSIVKSVMLWRTCQCIRWWWKHWICTFMYTIIIHVWSIRNKLIHFLFSSIVYNSRDM